jgi:hypothetical protein
LSEDKHKETKQGITCIRFGTQGKNPWVMRVVVKNNKIVFKAELI